MLKITNDRGTPFNVRIVRQDETYGLHDCLTHDEAEPLVEFYDARYTDDKHEPVAEIRQRGQFVSRYNLGTLLGRLRIGGYRSSGTGGIDLCGYEPDWKIDADTMERVRAYLREQELRDVLADAVDAVQYAYAKMRVRGTRYWVEGEAFLERAKALGFDVDAASLPNSEDV